ncbi:Phage protein TIGR01671 [Clostridium neonatale]|uniref:YopX family protein n=1 Tax=Clostridium neonatale TaxID=137838 RepID=UPI00291BB3D1|nr:Phage protein TIGR01671 [Clostridium neonatale]CAI3714098.1 Phage protein TIGR01671 [Clostridium neonatale]
MSRKIKFRMWDKDYKEMRIFGKNQHDDFRTNRNNELYYYNLQDGETSSECGAYELMQYTGIKDVTGKEIYEGDIVEFYNDVDYVLHPGIAKVIFDLGAFQMENEKYGIDYLGNMDIDDMCIRVIGNIYENPELLKSEVESNE